MTLFAYMPFSGCQFAPTSVWAAQIPASCSDRHDSCACVIYKVFHGGRRGFGWVKERLGCGLAWRQEKGQGLILLLHRDWWTQGTKMPVPGAGKQTDIRHGSGGSSGRIYCNPSFNQPLWTTFFQVCLPCVFVLCALWIYKQKQFFEVYFFGEHQELVLSCVTFPDSSCILLCQAGEL